MSIIEYMVTYCIGSARQKRDYFNKLTDTLLLDNTEVLFCASENGYNYFAYGEVPFGAFTVIEYLGYMRALSKLKVGPDTIRDFGLSPNKLLRDLSPVELRIVDFLEKTRGETSLVPVINLDGTRYSLRMNMQLKRFISRVGDCYICVTDNRFVKYAGNVAVSAFGKSNPLLCNRPAFYRARRLSAIIGAKRIAVFG